MEINALNSNATAEANATVSLLYEERRAAQMPSKDEAERSGSDSRGTDATHEDKLPPPVGTKKNRREGEQSQITLATKVDTPPATTERVMALSASGPRLARTLRKRLAGAGLFATVILADMITPPLLPPDFDSLVLQDLMRLPEHPLPAAAAQAALTAPSGEWYDTAAASSSTAFSTVTSLFHLVQMSLALPGLNDVTEDIAVAFNQGSPSPIARSVANYSATSNSSNSSSPGAGLVRSGVPLRDRTARTTEPFYLEPRLQAWTHDKILASGGSASDALRLTEFATAYYVEQVEEDAGRNTTNSSNSTNATPATSAGFLHHDGRGVVHPVGPLVFCPATVKGSVHVVVHDPHQSGFAGLASDFGHFMDDVIPLVKSALEIPLRLYSGRLLIEPAAARASSAPFVYEEPDRMEVVVVPSPGLLEDVFYGHSITAGAGGAAPGATIPPSSSATSEPTYQLTLDFSLVYPNGYSNAAAREKIRSESVDNALRFVHADVHKNLSQALEERVFSLERYGQTVQRAYLSQLVTDVVYPIITTRETNYTTTTSTTPSTAGLPTTAEAPWESFPSRSGPRDWELNGTPLFTNTTNATNTTAATTTTTAPPTTATATTTTTAMVIVHGVHNFTMMKASGVTDAMMSADNKAKTAIATSLATALEVDAFDVTIDSLTAHPAPASAVSVLQTHGGSAAGAGGKGGTTTSRAAQKTEVSADFSVTLDPAVTPAEKITSVQQLVADDAQLSAAADQAILAALAEAGDAVATNQFSADFRLVAAPPPEGGALPEIHSVAGTLRMPVQRALLQAYNEAFIAQVDVFGPHVSGKFGVLQPVGFAYEGAVTSFSSLEEVVGPEAAFLDESEAGGVGGTAHRLRRETTESGSKMKELNKAKRQNYRGETTSKSGSQYLLIEYTLQWDASVVLNSQLSEQITSLTQNDAAFQAKLGEALANATTKAKANAKTGASEGLIWERGRGDDDPPPAPDGADGIASTAVMDVTMKDSPTTTGGDPASPGKKDEPVDPQLQTASQEHGGGPPSITASSRPADLPPEKQFSQLGIDAELKQLMSMFRNRRMSTRPALAADPRLAFLKRSAVTDEVRNEIKSERAKQLSKDNKASSASMSQVIDDAMAAGPGAAAGIMPPSRENPQFASVKHLIEQEDLGEKAPRMKKIAGYVYSADPKYVEIQKHLQRYYRLKYKNKFASSESDDESKPVRMDGGGKSATYFPNDAFFRRVKHMFNDIPYKEPDNCRKFVDRMYTFYRANLARYSSRDVGGAGDTNPPGFDDFKQGGANEGSANCIRRFLTTKLEHDSAGIETYFGWQTDVGGASPAQRANRRNALRSVGTFNAHYPLPPDAIQPDEFEQMLNTELDPDKAPKTPEQKMQERWLEKRRKEVEDKNQHDEMQAAIANWREFRSRVEEQLVRRQEEGANLQPGGPNVPAAAAPGEDGETAGPSQEELFERDGVMAHGYLANGDCRHENNGDVEMATINEDVRKTEMKRLRHQLSTFLHEPEEDVTIPPFVQNQAEDTFADELGTCKLWAEVHGQLQPSSDLYVDRRDAQFEEIERCREKLREKNIVVSETTLTNALLKPYENFRVKDGISVAVPLLQFNPYMPDPMAKFGKKKGKKK
eukprot:g7156.t1